MPRMTSERRAAARNDPRTSHRHGDSLAPPDPGGAFVIRFRSARGKTRRTAGRVEHVQSGEELRFRSRKELLDFLVRKFPGDGGAD